MILVNSVEDIMRKIVWVFLAISLSANIFLLFFTNRYYFIEANKGAIFRCDRWTGQVTFVTRMGEREWGKQSEDTAKH